MFWFCGFFPQKNFKTAILSCTLGRLGNNCDKKWLIVLSGALRAVLEGGTICDARDDFPPRCFSATTRSRSIAAFQLHYSIVCTTCRPVTLAGGGRGCWLSLAIILVNMASSDCLGDDCVLQRGRSQSDPSSTTEVRLGEAHRAGKTRRGRKRDFASSVLSSLVKKRYFRARIICGASTHRPHLVTPESKNQDGRPF